MSAKVVPQWGVRYGDGEVEGPFTSRRDAKMHRAGLRNDIIRGDADAEDYEPMVIVERTFRLRISKWKRT